MTTRYIINTVLRETFFTLPEISTPSRKRELTEARQLCMFFLKKYTKLSLNDIGAQVSRDHATVLHAVKTVLDLCATDPVYRERFRRIDESITLYSQIAEKTGKDEPWRRVKSRAAQIKAAKRQLKRLRVNNLTVKHYGKNTTDQNQKRTGPQFT